MTSHTGQFSEGFAPDERSRDDQILARLDAIIAELQQLREEAALSGEAFRTIQPSIGTPSVTRRAIRAAARAVKTP